jgi:hypothetical protein
MLKLRSLRASKRERGRRSGRFAGSIEQFEDRVLLSSAAFAVTSDWGAGFGGQITISNTQSTAVAFITADSNDEPAWGGYTS